MADLSKIKLNGTTYNFKDAEARQLVSDLEDSMPEIPTSLSNFDNDVGYITSYTETDPTVPAWAKASTKPTYTAAEVGALPDTTVIPDVSGKVNKAGDTMTGDLIFTNDNSWCLIKPESTALNTPSRTIGLYTSGQLGSDNNAYTVLDFRVRPSGQNSQIILNNIYTPSDSYNACAASKLYVDNKSTLKTTAASTNTEYNLLGTATTNTNTSTVPLYQQDLLSFSKTNNVSRLSIGSTSVPGEARLYSSADSASGYTDLKSAASSTNARTITFPDASGIVALTTDIPSIPSWASAANKPSYTFSELTSHPTTLNDYGITDAYTKTEVDGLVSGVLHYKGTKVNTSALSSSGNTIGDVWHITADGSEWAWDGSEWQELGSTVDLSGYLQTGDIASWAKASTKPTYTASEVGALASNTTYVSTFNGQSGAITYTAPVTSVNGSTGAVSVTASSINAATDNHTHGSITNAGAITSNTTIASSDRLVFIDSSDSNKIKRSSITFGSSTSQYLANNGTWQNVPNTYDDTALAARVTALEQIPWVTYYTGSTTPSNAQGNNGDLYFQTAQ